jgi:hypothetical protein
VTTCGYGGPIIKINNELSMTFNLIQIFKNQNQLIEIILGLVLSNGYIINTTINTNFKMEFILKLINKEGENIMDFNN